MLSLSLLLLSSSCTGNKERSSSITMRDITGPWKHPKGGETV